MIPRSAPSFLIRGWIRDEDFAFCAIADWSALQVFCACYFDMGSCLFSFLVLSMLVCWALWFVRRLAMNSLIYAPPCFAQSHLVNLAFWHFGVFCCLLGDFGSPEASTWKSGVILPPCGTTLEVQWPTGTPQTTLFQSWIRLLWIHDWKHIFV